MNKIRRITTEAAEVRKAPEVAEDEDTMQVEATWEGVADQDEAEAEAVVLDAENHGRRQSRLGGTRPTNSLA
jgi:hypothetical protein